MFVVLRTVTLTKIKSKTEKLVIFCSSQSTWIEADFQPILNRLSGRKEETFCFANNHTDLSHLEFCDLMIYHNEVMINEKEK